MYSSLNLSEKIILNYIQLDIRWWKRGMPSKDYYALLGLEKGASEEDIKKLLEN